MAFNARYGLAPPNARQVSNLIFGGRVPQASAPQPKPNDLFRPAVRTVLEMDQPTWVHGDGSSGVGGLGGLRGQFGLGRYTLGNAISGIEDYQNDSIPTIKAKIKNADVMLKNAQAERKKCDTINVATAFSVGLSNAECIFRWDGQIGWWKDRGREARAALALAQSKDAEEKEKILAEETAAAVESEAVEPARSKPNAGSIARGGAGAGASTGPGAGSGGSAMSTGFLSSIPLPAKIIGGVILLGGVAFLASKMLK